MMIVRVSAYLNANVVCRECLRHWWEKDNQCLLCVYWNVCGLLYAFVCVCACLCLFQTPNILVCIFVVCFPTIGLGYVSTTTTTKDEDCNFDYNHDRDDDECQRNATQIRVQGSPLLTVFPRHSFRTFTLSFLSTLTYVV